MIGAAAVANAADGYDRKGSFKDAPEAYAPITWAGFYAGIHAGSRFGGELEFKEDGVGTTATADVDSAFLAGVHLGYNWQTSPNWVFGVETAISVLSDEIEETDITDYLASIGGRLGYAMGNSLLHGTGTSPSDGENGQCSDFGRWEVFRNSRQFIHPYTIISIRSAISTAAKISS